MIEHGIIPDALSGNVSRNGSVKRKFLLLETQINSHIEINRFKVGRTRRLVDVKKQRQNVRKIYKNVQLHFPD